MPRTEVWFGWVLPQHGVRERTLNLEGLSENVSSGVGFQMFLAEAQ